MALRDDAASAALVSRALPVGNSGRMHGNYLSNSLVAAEPSDNLARRICHGVEYSDNRYFVNRENSDFGNSREINVLR